MTLQTAVDKVSIDAKHLLLFDGGCNLCNGTVRYIVRHDHHRRFMFAALASTRGQALLHALHLRADEFNSLVYLRNGQVLLRSTAALYVARDLGGAWRLLFVLILLPRMLRDWMYDLVARNRHRWFGYRSTCTAQPEEHKERFLH